MIKGIILYAMGLMLCGLSYAQNDSLTTTTTGQSAEKRQPVYHLKAVADIPVTAAGVIWSIYAFPKIYDKKSSTVAEINNLNKQNVPGFDRWAINKYNKKADDNSDLLFYGSIPVPLLLFFDHDIRNDAAKVAFMYLETMAITGIFYTGSAYFFDRYRPYAYNTTDSIPMNEKTDGNAKNSFLGGHPCLVAATTFFMAKVYADYHPDSHFKYVLYGFAIAATGTTAYLRHIAGKHFPSDLLTGMAVGTLVGTLVPQFHKNKKVNSRITLLPFTGDAHGITFLYKL